MAYNIDVQFLLQSKNNSIKNKGAEGSAIFSMNIRFLKKVYFIGNLKLSEIRSLLGGSSATYKELIALSDSQDTSDSFPTVVLATVDDHKFKDWANKFEKSQVHAFFSNL